MTTSKAIAATQMPTAVDRQSRQQVAPQARNDQQRQPKEIRTNLQIRCSVIRFLLAAFSVISSSPLILFLVNVWSNDNAEK